MLSLKLTNLFQFLRVFGVDEADQLLETAVAVQLDGTVENVFDLIQLLVQLLILFRSVPLSASENS